MDISEVAQRSGVPASTLRFYEEKGLIASVGRRGLRRVFTADVLERLALIALGRAAGFTLDEISQEFLVFRPLQLCAFEMREQRKEQISPIRLEMEDVEAFL